MFVIRHQPSGRLVGDFGIYLIKGSMPEAKIDKKQRTGQCKGEGDDAEWEIGYSISPEFRGQGIVKEAVKVGLEGWARWVGIERIIAVSISMHVQIVPEPGRVAKSLAPRNGQSGICRRPPCMWVPKGQDVHAGLARVSWRWSAGAE